MCSDLLNDVHCDITTIVIGPRRRQNALQEKRLKICRSKTKYTKMLIWVREITRIYKIRSEYTRTFNVTQNWRKLHENGVRWYGRVMRRNEDYMIRNAMEKNEDGQRSPSQSPTTWTQTWNCKTMLQLKVLSCRIKMKADPSTVREKKIR